MRSSNKPETLHHRGQLFHLITRAPYARKRDGTASELLTWLGHCTVCGVSFESVTGPTRPDPRTECEQHRMTPRQRAANPTPAMLAARERWAEAVRLGRARANAERADAAVTRRSSPAKGRAAVDAGRAATLKARGAAVRAAWGGKYPPEGPDRERAIDWVNNGGDMPRPAK